MQCLLPGVWTCRRLVGRVRPQHVAFTAQDRNAALARWHEHVDLLMSSDLREHVRRVVLQRGDECVQFRQRLDVPDRHAVAWRCPWSGARPGGDRRGADAPAELLAAIRPTMAQRDGAAGCIGAQLVVVSNAGDERSTLLNEQRELGRRAALEGDTSRVWFEWSAAR